MKLAHYFETHVIAAVTFTVLAFGNSARGFAVKITRPQILVAFWLIAVCSLTGDTSRAQVAVEGQASERENWTEVSSLEGGFKAVFPKTPKETSRTLQFGSVYLQTREYVIRVGADYKVFYFTLPESSVDDNYRKSVLDGLRNTLLAELKGSITSQKETVVEGNPGRELEITGAKGDITRALIIIRERKVYQVTNTIPSASLGTSATDSSRRFLASFQLMPIVRVVDNTYLNNEVGEVDMFLKDKDGKTDPWRAIDSSGGIIDKSLPPAKVIKMATPHYRIGTPRVSGSIEIKVIIDEQGGVLFAQVIRGHPSLREISLEAARKSRFHPTLVQGKPVKTIGKITYQFAL